MRPILSLRSRLLFGALLWTFGLFTGAVLISTALMLVYPRYPLVLHGTARSYAVGLSVFVIVCMIAGVQQVRQGLSALNQLRARLAAVHTGNDRRVEGRYPAEVQPLVDDLNALLEQRENTVTRALAKAGDLAHGLKTPLAVLLHEAHRARSAGACELAASIEQQVERMQRQVERHLAHARAAASGTWPGTTSSVAGSIEGLSRTLTRLHAERGVVIDVDVSSAHSVRVQREDLDEMVGNLLDNACKWARSRVLVRSDRQHDTLVLLVDDDGPGLEPSLREAVLQRGIRADEAAPGSGLGLAIVRDLVDLYGGSIALERSPLGGLRAQLELAAS